MKARKNFDEIIYLNNKQNKCKLTTKNQRKIE